VTGNEAHEAQMMEDFSNDDLLGEENELSDVAYTFLGVQKGNSVEVRNAAILAASAPACLSSRLSGKPVNAVSMTQKITRSFRAEKSEASARDGTMGPTQRSIGTLPGTDLGAKGLDTQAVAAKPKKVHDLGLPTMPATRAAVREMKLTPLRQPSSMIDEEQMEVSLGRFDGPTEGVVTGGAQHVGDLSDAMLEAGVAADGESKKNWGVSRRWRFCLTESSLKCSVARNADVVDVDSFERAKRRVAVKNLEEP
jgi:hypothetical protein